MDPLAVLSLPLAVLGLVERIASLIRAYDDPSIASELSDILSELSILQAMLAETMVMMEDLHGEAPGSAHVALRRCQHLEKEMESLMAHVFSHKNRMLKAVLRVESDRKLTRLSKSFRSAVQLFRDISTNALTHDLLRDICDGNPASSIADLSRKTSRAASTKGMPLALNRLDPAFEDGTGQKAAKVPRKTSAQERLSLFDATISHIVDEDSTGLQAISPSDCVCGRRRRGKWATVRGKFDSGANANFIADDVIAREGLQTLVSQHSEPMEVKMFGVTFPFDKVITLNWQKKDEETSNRTEFWVASDTREFDLVIGEPWMMEHGFDVVDIGKARRRPQFFGSLKIGRKSKDQKRREAGTAAILKQQAQNERRVARLRPPSQLNPGLQSSSNSVATTPTNVGGTRMPAMPTQGHAARPPDSSVSGITADPASAHDQTAASVSTSSTLPTMNDAVASGPNTPNGASSSSIHQSVDTAATSAQETQSMTKSRNSSPVANGVATQMDGAIGA